MNATNPNPKQVAEEAEATRFLERTDHLLSLSGALSRSHRDVSREMALSALMSILLDERLLGIEKSLDNLNLILLRGQGAK